MAKLDAVPRPHGTRYVFFCPGCGANHGFEVRTDGGQPSWGFDGNLDAPTVTPSIKVTCDYPDAIDPAVLAHFASVGHKPLPRVCHLYLTAGKLQFLGDCTHPLAGTTFELPDRDEAPCRDGEHKWVRRQQGGPPDAAESAEWVCYCDVCGIEKTDD